jgi:FdhD protein
LAIPAERALTVYLDQHEVVTLMTLGAQPEWLVLGYLLNQRLITRVEEVASVQVDWSMGAGETGEPGVAAVRTHAGLVASERLQAPRVHTSGCGQGSLFADVLDNVLSQPLPPAQLQRETLFGILETMRLQPTQYRRTGSVHGCALFQGDQLLCLVEDVGRHNALDAIAGWMALQGETGQDKVFYTTGRLTSEMIIKAAQMGVPIVVSRSGITEMGLAVAQRLGLCAVGRALNRRFLCYSAPERLQGLAPL